jgi:hypothetical protein
MRKITMKKTGMLTLAVLAVFLYHVAICAQSNGRQPSGQPAKANTFVTAETPKESADVVRAEAQYVKALLASAQDPSLSEERQLSYWVRLARLGYMPAFERISKLVNESGAGGWDWAVCIEAIRGDKATVVKLLRSERQEVRYTGIFLAGYLGMQKDLREFAEKAINLDPITRQTLWIGRALADDFSIVPALAVAADDKGKDGRAAKTALAAYFSETGEMSLADFQKRLEAVLADTRPAAKAATKPVTGKVGTLPILFGTPFARARKKNFQIPQVSSCAHLNIML